MKRKRILTQYLLYFLMFMFLIVAGCSSGGDGHDNTPDEPTQAKMITISGTVTDLAGKPVSGVVMSAMIDIKVMNFSLFTGSLISDTFSIIRTDASGNYSIKVPAAPVEFYTLVLTPSKRGYTFAPTEQAITVGLVDVPNVNFTARATMTYSLSDLNGSWRINTLRAGAQDMWMRARITVDDGIATCDSYADSTGVTTCPAGFDLGFAIDADGVVTQTGRHAVTDGGHMTMNSAKNFMAGTGTNGSSYQLMIAQKEVEATTYDAGPLQGIFVFHGLHLGGTPSEWRYGRGETDANGVITMAEETGALVPVTTMNGVTLELAADGVVTDTSGRLANFEGFLSADARTIVGTYTGALSTTDYGLIVIQFITAGQKSSMTGGSYNHLLATVGNNAVPFWAHHYVNISRLEASLMRTLLGITVDVDIMLSYAWEMSDNLGLTQIQKLAFTDLEKINFDNNGTAIIRTGLGTAAHPYVQVFHGQLAWDGTFLVGVETMTLNGNDFHALEVITH